MMTRRKKLKGVAMFLRKVEGIPLPDPKKPKYVVPLPGHIYDPDSFLGLLRETEGLEPGEYLEEFFLLDEAFEWATCTSGVNWGRIYDSEFTEEALQVLSSWRTHYDEDDIRNHVEEESEDCMF